MSTTQHRNSDFTQVCLWPATIVGVDKVEAFEKFMLDTFKVRVKYLEEVLTNPDICPIHGPIAGTGGRNDTLFAIHSEDVMKFALPRFEYGIRWWEDVVKYNDNAYLYSEDLLKKYPPTW